MLVNLDFRITDIIYNIITEFQATNYVSVVATSSDVNKIGKKLREARGVHFFRTVLAIPPLEKVRKKKFSQRFLFIPSEYKFYRRRESKFYDRVLKTNCTWRMRSIGTITATKQRVGLRRISQCWVTKPRSLLGNDTVFQNFISILFLKDDLTMVFFS